MARELRLLVRAGRCRRAPAPGLPLRDPLPDVGIHERLPGGDRDLLHPRRVLPVRVGHGGRARRLAGGRVEARCPSPGHIASRRPEERLVMRTSRASAFLRGVTIAAVALLLAGCGTDPFAPVPLNSGPPVLVVGDDGTVTYRQASSLEPEDDDDQGDERSLTVEKEIDGVKGGWLECGRFLLAIPSGAFDSTGTVTMSMPDSTAMVVELEIAPKRLNQFRVPVLLSLKTTGADV